MTGDLFAVIVNAFVVWLVGFFSFGWWSS